MWPGAGASFSYYESAPSGDEMKGGKSDSLQQSQDVGDQHLDLLSSDLFSTHHDLAEEPELAIDISHMDFQQRREWAWGGVGFVGKARTQLWIELLGCHEEAGRREAQRYYQHLLDQHEHALMQTVAMKHTLRQIGKDLTRTFDVLEGPSQDGLEGKIKSLDRVLVAYALYNPRVGYCQGMNFLVAVILTVLREEYLAFAMLCHLLRDKAAMYCDSLCGTVVDMAGIDALIRFHRPELHQRIAQLDCSIYALMSNWFLCLLINAPLPVKRALRLWDVMLLHPLDPFILQKLIVGMVCEAAAGMGRLESPGDVRDAFKRVLCEDTKFPDLLARLQKHVEEDSFGTADQLRGVREMHKSTYVERQMRVGLSGFQLATVARSKWNLFSESEIKQVWQYFIAPDCWGVCANGFRIADVAHFHAALAKCLVRQQKLSVSAMLCCVTQRLFEMFAEGEAMLSFAQFLKGIQRFVKSNRAERLQFCFEFCDRQHEVGVGKKSLARMIMSFDEYYNGKRNAKVAARETSLFVDFAFEKYAVTLTHSRRRRMSTPLLFGDDAVNRNGVQAAMPLSATVQPPTVPSAEPEENLRIYYEQFAFIAPLHPLLSRFFCLDEINEIGLQQNEEHKQH